MKSDVVYRASPAALSDVRGIGVVQAGASDEVGYDDGVVVTNTLVMDVGSARVEEAVDKAASLLQQRGWVTAGKKQPWTVFVESARRGAHLALSSFSADRLARHQGMLESLDMKFATTESAVIIEANVYPEDSSVVTA
ncbi:hypothetical protein E1267_37750 [Nonomuraea longispora]|uniref:Uncharacterized protein n=1 Tax=Nonomuraea longispora TaxID=1848320 RepID=A0A4R4MTM3_9ACTN|nr:hypothetical protein [Nonomuraea longispora]TDB99387.1 hypothetical protein E1267_37750 [Nonomuraea longispora]